MGVSLVEHGRNEEILEEAKVEAIATVISRVIMQNDPKQIARICLF